MSTRRLTLFVAIMASLGASPLLYSSSAFAADAAAIQVKDGYYKTLVDFDFMRQYADIPLKKGVMIIDSRPAARQYDPGHIPGAINIPDSQFDKLVDKLPTDKAMPLIYYCGGLECVLSDRSAEKARKLGYTNVLTYPPGYPEWEKLHGAPAPTVAATAGAAPATAATAALVPGKEKGSVTVASFEQVWKTNPGSVMLVDVRDPREYAIGTIKGSVNIPMNELEKKIATLPTDKPVVFVCGTGARSGEAYDTVKLLGGKVQASFLDADVKFNADGSYTTWWRRSSAAAAEVRSYRRHVG